MQEEDMYSAEYWKLGFIYFNPQNNKVFIPKRFGFGWTLNFGSWKSWIVIGVFIALIVALKFFIKSK